MLDLPRIHHLLGSPECGFLVAMQDVTAYIFRGIPMYKPSNLPWLHPWVEGRLKGRLLNLWNKDFKVLVFMRLLIYVTCYFCKFQIQIHGALFGYWKNHRIFPEKNIIQNAGFSIMTRVIEPPNWNPYHGCNLTRMVDNHTLFFRFRFHVDWFTNFMIFLQNWRVSTPSESSKQSEAKLTYRTGKCNFFYPNGACIK